MSREQKKTKRPKRIIYCERCGHPEDRHEVEDSTSMGCTAKTIKPGSPQCKCPRMVYPIGGYMDRVGQALAKEKARAGAMPEPFEVPPDKRRR